MRTLMRGALAVGMVVGCGGHPSPAKRASTLQTRTAEVEPDHPRGAAAARDAALAKSMGEIFDAFTNGNPQLTSDGTKVAFMSNRDGYPQLYVADARDPKSKPIRVATTTNRIHDFAIAPDQKTIIFSTDPAIDERYELYAADIEGKSVRALPRVEPIQRDIPAFAKDLPRKLFYSARPNEKVETRILTLGEDEKSETVLYTEPYLSLLAGVDAEGRHALLVRYKTLLDSPIMRVDLQSGKAQRLYPPEGVEEASFTPGFMPDGKRFVVATNRGGRGLAVLLFDVASASVVATYEVKPTTGNVDMLAMSRDGSRIGLIVDAGNHSEVHFLDGATLHSVADVAMPLGTGHKMTLSDDGRRALIEWSTPAKPGDLYSIDTTSGAVIALRDEARSSIDALPAIEVSLATVPSFDGLPVPVNVYLPAQRTGRVPVLVYLHGGISMSSAVAYDNMTRFFTAHGFAVVEPNIRGSTGFGLAYEKADDGPKREDSFRDITAVGEWLRKQPWADGDRLAMGGGSYGGYLTLMAVIRDPGLWKAGLEYAGIFDWKTDMASASSSVDFQKSEFGDISDKRLAELSPRTYVDQIRTPLFVYQGKNDTRVPRSEADALVRALRMRGVTVEYMVADQEGHSIARRDTQMEVYPRSLRFLEATLKMPMHP